MADISMCFGKGCALKDLCYRHNAKANEWGQSYLMIELKPGETHCDSFWPDAVYEGITTEDIDFLERINARKKKK